jgi:hypothetical protein
MLKPTALKGARWVLRGEGGGDAFLLPDRIEARRLTDVNHNEEPGVAHGITTRSKQEG